MNKRQSIRRPLIERHKSKVRAKRTASARNVLYDLPLRATRSGALFHAHPYPTKISPESIALIIACHTSPGDTVFDGFGGSCTTAVASLLCSRPTDEMRSEAARLGLAPKWGPRNAVVYELSGLGSFIGQTLCSRTDPSAFERAAKELLSEVEHTHGWLYATQDPSGKPGRARYFIWSDHLECPRCHKQTTLWQTCVSLNPARISKDYCCPACQWTGALDTVPRLFDEYYDDILKKSVRHRVRTLVRVDGETKTIHWSREPDHEDVNLVQRIQDEAIPQTFPITPMMGKGGTAWGDLWRAGYHEGITHVHHFYTRRNLIAMASVWKLISQAPQSVRDALMLWASSYNNSHSTLMTRVVAKKDHKDLVLTSAQPGVLYISGLPVEKNIFSGLRRKIKTITEAFRILRDKNGTVQVVQGSGTNTGLPDQSVDYVFMDPPFGGNIPYSEVNFISEAWLRRLTYAKDEAIVSTAQKKELSDYENLLRCVFKETRRILKTDGQANVVFHSTQADVWTALVNAYTSAGFAAGESTILDKRQGSFKQVTTKNFAQGDPLLLLRPIETAPSATTVNLNNVMGLLIEESSRLKNPDEMSPKRLYSRFVSYYLRQHQAPPINANEFYEQLASMKGIL